MRRVNELNIPLLAAKEPLGMINNKIEDNIKNLTLAPIKLVYTNVSTKLPRELRDCIYNYLYSKHVGPPDHRTSMSRLTDLVILRHCIGDSKEMDPLVTFQSWLGESFTCELTEHWYRNNTFNFGSWWTDYMIFWLSRNLWWQSHREVQSNLPMPGHLVRHLEFSLAPFCRLKDYLGPASEPRRCPTAGIRTRHAHLLSKNATLVNTMALDYVLGPELRIVTFRELMKDAFPDLHNLAKGCKVIQLKVYLKIRALVITSEGCTLDSVVEDFAEMISVIKTYKGDQLF
jgi:hypothetical protein